MVSLPKSYTSLDAMQNYSVCAGKHCFEDSIHQKPSTYNYRATELASPATLRQRIRMNMLFVASINGCYFYAQVVVAFSVLGFSFSLLLLSWPHLILSLFLSLYLPVQHEKNGDFSNACEVKSAYVNGKLQLCEYLNIVYYHLNDWLSWHNIIEVSIRTALIDIHSSSSDTIYFVPHTWDCVCTIHNKFFLEICNVNRSMNHKKKTNKQNDMQKSINKHKYQFKIKFRFIKPTGLLTHHFCVWFVFDSRTKAVLLAF